MEYKINQTKNISGIRNETIFQVNLTDNSNYEWNCEVCDTSNNCNFSESNFTFTVNSSYYVPIPIEFYQYPTISFYNETVEIILFETNIDVNGTVEYWQDGGTIKIKNLTDYSTVHEFNITSLTPGTKYYYRINLTHYVSWGQSNISFNSSFVTANDSLTSFTFAVLGDSRPASGIGINENVFVPLMNRILTYNPAFILIVGDTVEGEGTAYDDYDVARDAWKDYSDSVWNISDHIPIFNILGNHEVGSNYASQNNTLKRYREVWIHPINGNGSNDTRCYESNCWREVSYSFEYGNSLFIITNTEEPGHHNPGNITENQYDWFNKTVNESGYTHKFVFAHKPLAGSTKSNTLFGGDSASSARLDNLMYNNGITAAFYGHNHYYCKNTTQNGMLHIITGGAGAPLSETGDCLALAEDKVSNFHFLIINITGNAMNGTAINLTGSEIGNFSRIMD